VKYVVQKASSILRKKHASDREHWNLIVAHLGNGASVTAVHEGKVRNVFFGPLCNVRWISSYASDSP
jgi:acetate kinase